MNMDCLKITTEYYSSWLGNRELLNQIESGIHFIYSSERNRIQYGYSDKFDLYILSQPNRVIVSYGDAFAEKVEKLNESIDFGSTTEMVASLKTFFGERVSHHVKYVMDTLPERETSAKLLIPSDYPQYLIFFKESNPDCRDTDWLYDYFTELVNENLCWGIFADDKLISCTDAPSVPYMRENVREIGINTLAAYRGNGYATDVCIACAKELKKQRKCPQWSTSISNYASQRLAEAVGFTKFADVITVTL